MPSTPDLRALPLLVAALCLGSGIVAAALVGGPAAAWSLAFALSLALMAALLAARRWMPLTASLWPTLAFCIALVALGGWRVAAHYRLPAHHVARLLEDADARADVLLEGTVADEPLTNAALRTRFRLDAARLVLPDTTLAVTGRVQVALVQSAWRDTVFYPPLRHGDRVRLAGTLRLPPQKRNPADFDYGAFLEKQGVFATLTVRDSTDVELQSHTAARSLRLLARTRAYLTSALAAYVPSDRGRSVMRALLLGDRSLLDPDMRDAFAQTGLMHLLAVSGLHVLLVGMVLFVLLRPMLLRLSVPRRKAEVLRAAVTLAVLVAYAFVTGGSPSVVRAVVMATVFIGGVVLERPATPMNTLGAAALVLLLFRPTMLFEPGFQLSFAAVAGLVLLPRIVRPYLPDRSKKVRFWIVEGFVTTLAATLATAPILLYHFGRLPLAALVLNYAAMFSTMAAFAAGLLLTLTAWWPPVAAGFGAMADYAARWLVFFAEAGDAHLSWLAFDGYVTNPFALAALTASVLTLALWTYTRVRFKMLTLALVLAAAGVWMGVAQGRHEPRLEVVFFDVGQGDAALVTFPNGKRMLVDAGPRDATFDAGEKTILPHLRRFGVKKLDAVVVSHPHADHLGGLPAVLRNIPVGAVYDNGEVFSSSLYDETRFLLDTLDIPRHALQAGDTLALDPATGLFVLAPERADAHPSNTNDASVVLRLAFGETSILFAGDAEAPSEAAMVARFDTLLGSTVVKVGHHGSRTSSTPDFMERVRPDLALVSVAAFNVYRLPSDSVLARWRRAGADVRLTRDGGALWLRSDGRGVDIVPWQR